jgi:uncharacterized protein YndB with AHSA1/START domain
MSEPLHAEAEGIANASPAAVWALICDVTRYPEWGPWRAGVYRSLGSASERGPGAVYALTSARRYALRYPVMVEQVLAAEEGRRLVYTLLKGMPVRNYRAEVTLTPADGGTRIRWAATWDSTLGGRFVHRSLSALYPRVVAGLAAAAEQASAA